MLVWDVTCPDIFTPSYTSMEVGVVLAGQMMKTLKYQTISTIHFFISDYCYHTFFHLYQNRVVGGLLSLSEQRYRVSFGQKLPPFFLDLGRRDRGC